MNSMRSSPAWGRAGRSTRPPRAPPGLAPYLGLMTTPEGIELDGDPIPDLIPVLSLALARCPGEHHVFGLGRLRIKECDRLHMTATLLAQLGVEVREEASALWIRGEARGRLFRGGFEVATGHDHRIAMTAAIAASLAEQALTLDDGRCVAKSYPDFWRDYRQLGGRAEADWLAPTDGEEH